MIPFEHAADHPPSQSAGDHTPVSERSANARWEGAFSPTDGRATCNAQLTANARSRPRSFGNPREGGGRQFPRVLLHRFIAGRSRFSRLRQEDSADASSGNRLGPKTPKGDSRMHKLKPIVAKTPEELAGALGLSSAAAKEWQVQHVLVGRLKEIARRRKITHAEIAKRAGTSRTRVTAILNDDLQHVSSDLLIRILASLGYRVKVSVVRSDTAA